MKTYCAKPAEVTRKWLLVDAEGMVLGRLASQVAALLRGKHKPIYTPHVDTGDHVIIINADKIRVTANKMETKIKYRHSGYPGALREIPFGRLMEKDAGRTVRKVIIGMLPHTTLGRQMARKLKVYAGSEHPHAAQQPQDITETFRRTEEPIGG